MPIRAKKKSRKLLLPPAVEGGTTKRASALPTDIALGGSEVSGMPARHWAGIPEKSGSLRITRCHRNFSREVHHVAEDQLADLCRCGFDCSNLLCKLG